MNKYKTTRQSQSKLKTLLISLVRIAKNPHKFSFYFPFIWISAMEWYLLNTLTAFGKFPLCLTGNISNHMVDWIGMGHSLPFNPHLQQKQVHNA